MIAQAPLHRSVARPQGFSGFRNLTTFNDGWLMTCSSLGAKSLRKLLPWAWMALRRRWEPDVNQWAPRILQGKMNTLVLWCVSGKKTCWYIPYSHNRFKLLSSSLVVGLYLTMTTLVIDLKLSIFAREGDSNAVCLLQPVWILPEICCRRQLEVKILQMFKQTIFVAASFNTILSTDEGSTDNMILKWSTVWGAPYYPVWQILPLGFKGPSFCVPSGVFLEYRNCPMIFMSISF